MLAITEADALLVDHVAAVRTNHVGIWDYPIHDMDRLFIQERLDQAFRRHVLPIMARKPEKKVKLTELEKRMVGLMQARGSLLRRSLHSWEKSAADRLVRKGYFEEMVSPNEYFRTYRAVKPATPNPDQMHGAADGYGGEDTPHSPSASKLLGRDLP